MGPPAWMPLGFLPLLLLGTQGYNSKICGRRPLLSSYAGMQIMGGMDALPGAWPWLVSIQIPTQKGHQHSCGGSLISNRWVLTAAHCLKAKRRILARWRIVSGISELSRLSDLVQIRSVKRAVLHQEYNPHKETNDIALIQLDHPVTFDDFTQPACLPSTRMAVTTFSPCYISGWGTTTQNTMHTVDILQEARVHLIDSATCNSSHWYNGAITSNNLCAGYKQGDFRSCQVCRPEPTNGRVLPPARPLLPVPSSGITSLPPDINNCQGDSGGPLMCKYEVTSRYYVIGITSWSQDCAQAYKLGRYTSTQSFLEWILENTGLQEREEKPPEEILPPQILPLQPPATAIKLTPLLPPVLQEPVIPLEPPYVPPEAPYMPPEPVTSLEPPYVPPETPYVPSESVIPLEPPYVPPEPPYISLKPVILPEPVTPHRPFLLHKAIYPPQINPPKASHPLRPVIVLKLLIPPKIYTHPPHKESTSPPAVSAPSVPPCPGASQELKND